jgi:hypothetical protein
MGAILEFFGARRWLIYLIAFALIAGAVVWFCAHLISVGVQRQKDDDAKMLAEWQRKADIETGRLQGVADAAEKARAKEHADLVQYRREHPLHGRLCKPTPAATVPATASPQRGDESASARAGDLQPLPARDTERRQYPDQLGMLDVLTARCDALSATVREFQSRSIP